MTPTLNPSFVSVLVTMEMHDQVLLPATVSFYSCMDSTLCFFLFGGFLTGLNARCALCCLVEPSSGIVVSYALNTHVV